MTPQDALIKVGLSFVPEQYRKAIALIDQKPMSCSDLAKELDTSLEYSRLILSRLHKAKVACVVHWSRTRTNGIPTKIWGLGTKDEKQPVKLLARERSKRYRDSKKGLSGEVRLGVWGL